MRLLNPDPGEVADRLTILELKIKYGTEKGRDTEAFSEEQKALIGYMKFTFADTIPAPLFFTLHEVNHELWKLEDEIREIMRVRGSTKRLGSGLGATVARIAFAIPRANDRRMELVKQINAFFSITRQEKLY